MPKLGVAFFMVLSRVAADFTVSVLHDATYQARGPICGGFGDIPTGIACPLKGEVAIADCNSTLLSYNGSVCVAPVDAACVANAESTWSCVFPDETASEDWTSTLTVANEDSVQESPWKDLPWRAPPPIDSITATNTDLQIE
ncbi:hypothetical protein DVH05_003377 [Phytophthora capsici]|nr:hypothetical protein DVH05_003377 [Phytophthora capsici]